MADGTTLRFSVEVAADQAEGALKAMTAAFDQAGVKAKAALQGIGGASRKTTGDLEELKKGMGKARETAMFFTQSLGEFGPQGRTAQLAVSGLAGAIIGGGGLLLGLNLAQAAVRLLTDVWEEEANAAKKATEENLKAAKAIADAAGGRSAAAQAERDRVYYSERTLAAKKFQEDLKAINAKIADAKKRSGDDVASEEVKALVAERAKLIQSMKEEAKARQEIEFAAEVTASADNAAKSEEEKKRIRDEAWAKYQAELKTRTDFAIDEAKREYEANMAFDKADAENRQKLGAEMNAQAWKWQEEEAARLVKQDEQNARAMDEQMRSAEEMGATYGAIFGAMATGQMTVQQGFAAIGQTIIKMVVESAIASITADAARAGAGAAASQAGIPVIGPILAISAMGAIMASVMGLIGSVGHSASGGFDVGNFAPVTQLHPKEMVLPAALANRVRNMTGGGGSVQIVINATDAKSVRRLLLDNPDALGEAIGQARRKGKL